MVVGMGKSGRWLHSGRVVPFYYDGDGHPWRVEVTWAEVDGRAEPVGLMIMSYSEVMDGENLVGYGDGLRPIRSSLLRGDLMSAIESDRKRVIEDAQSILAAEHRFEDGERAEDFDKARHVLEVHSNRRGRKLADGDGTPLPTDEALAKVAAIYTAAWQEGRPPTKAVAESLGISRSAAAKRVRRARDAGHLPDTRQGKQKGGRS